jgi:RimJ/RimL family protein N-acetyltransferase
MGQLVQGLRMATVTVRTASVEDAAAMGAVHVAAWQAAYRCVMPDEFLDALDAEERADQWRSVIEANPTPTEGRRLVVSLDGAVVGVALVWSCRDEGSPPELGELVLINLAPAAWGTGAGSALLTECEVSLAAFGYTAAILWVATENRRARRFYEREGWSADGAQRVEVVDGASVHESRYRKRLAP